MQYKVSFFFLFRTLNSIAYDWPKCNQIFFLNVFYPCVSLFISSDTIRPIKIHNVYFWPATLCTYSVPCPNYLFIKIISSSVHRRPRSCDSKESGISKRQYRPVIVCNTRTRVNSFSRHQDKFEMRRRRKSSLLAFLHGDFGAGHSSVTDHTLGYKSNRGWLFSSSRSSIPIDQTSR